MALQEAGVKFTAKGAQSFIKDVTQSSAVLKEFGITLESVQKRAAKDTKIPFLDRSAALKAQLNDTKSAIHDFRNTVETDLKAVEKEFEDALALDNVVNNLNKVGAAMLAVGAAGGALLVGVGLQASRIEELSVLLEVTRKNAIYLAEAEGDLAKATTFTSEAVQAQADGIRGLHLSGEVANRVVSDLIRYNLDWTKATELARLAQDAATFAMQDSSEAVLGLINGITTLQPRILRTYGLMINLNVAYRKFAEVNDVAVKDMSVMQRQQAAFQEVLSLAPSIAGAYEAAMGTASKQVRSLKTDIVNLSEAFGEEYTPALNAAVGVGRDLLHILTDLPDPMQAFLAYATATGSALSVVGGTALLVIPRLSALKEAFTAMSAAIGLSNAAMLGLGVTLGVGIPLVAGVVAAVIAIEKAHREEAAAAINSSEKYNEYIKKLEAAEIGAYGLTEGLYEIAKGANAAEKGLDALALTEAVRELEAFFGINRTGVDWIDDLLAKIPQVENNFDNLEEALKRQTDSLTDAKLAAMADTETMAKLAVQQGYNTQEAREFVEIMVSFAQALMETRRAREAELETADRIIDSLEREAQEAEELREKLLAIADDGEAAMTRMATAVDFYSLAVQEAIRNEDIWFKSSNRQAILDFEKERAEETQKTAEKIVAAEEKAADARLQANIQLNDSLEDLNIKHAASMAEILEDLANVGADLQDKILEAERQTAEARLELQRELGQDLADIREEFVQKQADLERERLRDLEDLDREYAEKRTDALRDLNSDLVDMERDLAKELESIREKHLQNMLDLERDYAQKREDILDDYAERAKEIEEKYSIEPPPPDFDDLRRELFEELERLRELQENAFDNIDYSGDIDAIIAQIEALKEEELAELEAAKEEQLALLEEQLAEEQAAREAAYEEELAAAQKAHEEQRAERERQYREKLDDIRVQQGKERDEINRNNQRRLDDLKLQHDQERAEAQRRHQESLDDLDVQLAAEKVKLAEAAEDNREKLQERLQDEKDSYTEREDELNRHHERRKRDIDAQEQGEIADLRIKLGLKLQEWIDNYEGINNATRVGLGQMAVDTAVGLDAVVEEHRRAAAEIKAIWADAGMVGESPAPFFKDMSESWMEGLEVGLGSDAASLMGDLQSQVGGVLPAQQVALPIGAAGGNSTQTNTTYELHTSMAGTNYGSLVDQFRRMEMSSIT